MYDIANEGRFVLPSGAHVTVGRESIQLTEAGDCSGASAPLVAEHWSDGDRVTTVEGDYSDIAADGDTLVGRGALTLPGGGVLRFADRWQSTDEAVRLVREVVVVGDGRGGFLTEIGLTMRATRSLWDLQAFAPGMQYGDPDRVNPLAIGGRAWRDAGVTDIRIREDRLPAPLLAVRASDGATLAMLNPRPDGATTVSDAADTDAIPLVEDELRFGALRLAGTDDGVRIGYTFPGTEGEVTYRGDTYPDGQVRRWRRRYHPVRDGLTQHYVIELRAEPGLAFPQLANRAWRWAWRRLSPQPIPQDVDTARGVLLDQLASAVVERDDRAGLPHFLSAVTRQSTHRQRDHALMGFTGRNTDCAWHLVRAAEAADGPAASRYRRLGVKILDSFAALATTPPTGEGFDLQTGEPVPAAPRHERSDVMLLRGLTEGGRAVARAWRFERDRGRDHPGWLRWSRELGDWLLSHQRPDGSFPRSWLLSSDKVTDESGASSYNAIPFLVELHRCVPDESYLDAAATAGEYCWESGHRDGVFVGGTLDNPDVIDKEAGTIALDAYLALCEQTGDTRWVQRAAAAADFAETWMYIWDVPMPYLDDTVHGWKLGASTVGLQLIASGHSLVDMYMAFDVGSYARLATHTGDDHYLDVARLLLHNTKTMLAMPGRGYDLAGPGWQQEHWSLAPRRGDGLHRGWLPWVTCSHLEGIASLEDHDPDVYADLARPT